MSQVSTKICTGVRQGCAISSLLFNCYVEGSIQEYIVGFIQVYRRVKNKSNGFDIGIKGDGVLIPMI